MTFRVPLPFTVQLVVQFCLLGCQPQYEGFSAMQIEVAKAAAAAVRPELIQSHLTNIYGARLDDAETNFEFHELCPKHGCAYSRSATAELARSAWSKLPQQWSFREHHVDSDGLATTNLLLDLPSASSSDRWVIAVAHYDAWYGGANDNASGVAVTLEAAFALSSLALAHNVRLLLTDGEELGLIGAERYIEDYGVENVLIVLNADSIAHVGTEGGWLANEPEGTEYIVQGNEDSARAAYRVADLAKRLPEPLEMRPIIYPNDGIAAAGFAVGYDLSDHAPFWLRGVPALFPFPAGGKPDWYHTPDDTPNTVDRDRLRRFGRFWAASIAAFAMDPR